MGRVRAPHLTRFGTALGLLSVVVAATAAAQGVSEAAVTTIGPPTLSEGTMNDSTGGTYVEYSGTAPAPEPEYVSPIEGTIVTWRIASGSSGNKVRLRVLRPIGGGKFTGVGTSTLEVTSSPLATFTTSLPIKAGDVIGVDNQSSALMFTSGVLGAYAELFMPALADGAPAAEPKLVSGGVGFKLQINADIQPKASGGGSGGGGNGGGGQTGSPMLAGLKVSPTAFSAATSGSSVARNRKPKTGATVTYTDTQPATTTFTVFQKQPGRKNSQGVCAKPARRSHGKRCTRTVRIGSFTHTDTAGANSLHFTGRVNGRRLKPGGYQLQAVARNAAGLTSRPVGSGFGVKT